MKLQKLSRTQISLPNELRKEVNKHIKISGESMSEYVRQCIILRINMEKSKLDRKQKAIDAFVNAESGNLEWQTNEGVEKWLNEIRKD